jgi:hypothetical protein
MSYREIFLDLLTARMCDVSFNTVLELLPEIAHAYAEYQDRACLNLKFKRIQCDECRSFCYAKDKNLPDDKQGRFVYGSIWTWSQSMQTPSWCQRS